MKLDIGNEKKEILFFLYHSLSFYHGIFFVLVITCSFYLIFFIFKKTVELKPTAIDSLGKEHQKANTHLAASISTKSKSIFVIDIKPWDAETDINAMEQEQTKRKKIVFYYFSFVFPAQRVLMANWY
jgi:hypothetical protein